MSNYCNKDQTKSQAALDTKLPNFGILNQQAKTQQHCHILHKKRKLALKTVHFVNTKILLAAKGNELE
jgi:hypothetical protein